MKSFYLLGRTFAIFLLLLSSYRVSADHIAGGELSVTCADNGDSLIIRAIVLRECSGVSLGKQVAIQIKSLEPGCSFFQTIKPELILTEDITPLCAGAKSICSGGTFAPGIERWTYEMKIAANLVPCASFRLSNSLCCFPMSISTGADGQNFYTYTDYHKQVQCHSTPKMEEVPLFVTLGNDLVINISGSNIAEDSTEVVYALAGPLQSENVPTTWSSGYSYLKPVKFFGWPDQTQSLPRGFHLDSSAGILAFRPIQEEISLLGIKASKYKTVNGSRVLVSETIRQHLIVVKLGSSGNKNPVLDGPLLQSVCSGTTGQWTISGRDADRDDRTKITVVDQLPWFTVDDSDTSKNQKVKINYNTTGLAPGTYSIRVKITDDNCPLPGSSSRSYRLNVIQNDGLGGKPYAYADSCGILHVGVDSLVYPGNYPQINWSYLGGKPFSKLSHFSSGIADTGTFLVNLTLSDPDVCTPFTWFDTVHVVPGGIWVNNPRIQHFCKGRQHYLKPDVGTASGGAYIFTWLNQNVTNDSIAADPMEDSTYYPFSVATLSGCGFTDSILVINELPEPHAGSFPSMCNTPAAALTLNAGPRQSWSGPGVSFSSGKYTFRPGIAGPGAHTIYLTETTVNGCSGKDSTVITVYDVPVADIETAIDSSVVPPVYTFSNNNHRSGLNYSWSYSVAAADSPAVWITGTDSVLEVTQVYRAPYEAKVKLHVTDVVSGCKGEDSTKVALAGRPTGMAKLEWSSLRIYPNPAHDALFVEIPGIAIKALEFMDIQGRMVMQVPAAAAGETIRIEKGKMASGTYFLKLITADGNSLNYKITWN